MMPCARERLRPGLAQRDLAGAGRRLALLERQVVRVEAEDAAAERDGAGGDDHDVAPLGLERGDILGQALQPARRSLPVAPSTSSAEPILMMSGDRGRGRRLISRHLSRAPTRSRSWPARVPAARPWLRRAPAARHRARRRRPGAGGARDLHHLGLAGFLQRLGLGLDLVGVERVDLVEDDDLGLFGQLLVIGGELAADGLVGARHVLLGAVDQVDQHGAALDMAEETVADAGALMRALDQPGNVGQHEIALADAHHAEIGMERRERIVGDLGLGRRNRGEKRRFAGIGQADQPGIGDQLQPEPDPLLLALLARDWRGAAPGWRRS